jgi:hypothetical protein
MLKKDNTAFGALIGLVMPLLFFGLLLFISKMVETGTMWTSPLEPDRMMLLALAINLVPLRIYFVNLKFDKTGRGILLVTFLLMVCYFIYIRYV